MLPKNCGKLLYNAVRETLEIMAFADVIPCSIKVAGEEFAQDDDFAVKIDPLGASEAQGWGDTAEASDTWGTAAPEVTPAEENLASESWGDSPEPTAVPAIEVVNAADDWGVPGDLPSAEEVPWGEHSNVMEPAPPAPPDPWGDAQLAEACVSGQSQPKEADFDEMVTAQTDWCWACMNVNSPDVHSVWFIVPQSLAHALMTNMYAGEETEFNTPLIRDLIAELTNVLGGRLMLLLEEMGGRFTLTVPDIGFGFPDIPEVDSSQSVVCKIVVDNEHPVIVVLCFNQGKILTAN